MSPRQRSQRRRLFLRRLARQPLPGNAHHVACSMTEAERRRLTCSNTRRATDRAINEAFGFLGWR